MQSRDARAGHVLHVRRVKAHVEIEDAVDADLLARLDRQLAIERSETPDNLIAPRFWQAGGHSRCESFKMADDQEQLASVLCGERSDDEPLVRAASDGGDESFLLQSVQGTTNRRSAQAKPVCHGTLGDARARWELSPDDQAAKLVVDERDVV